MMIAGSPTWDLSDNDTAALSAILNEYIRAESDLKEAVEALLIMEWASRDNGYPYCPACLQSKRHGPGCTIFDVLAKHPTL